MKKIILSFLTIITLFACSSDDDSSNTEDNCETAASASLEAAIDFNDATNENYTDLCTAYKTALEAQIDACGDLNGAIQAIVDDLGDCTQETDENTQGDLSVTAGTLSLDFDEVNIVVEDGLVKVTGETSASNNYNIYFELAEGTTGTDVIQNFQIELTSVFYPYNEGTQFDFTSEIETNSDGVLLGSFYNVVTNNEGADMSLTNGSINLEY
ncbi:hypothetical protein ACFQ3R_00480 [Mesonia ostreae]|uniref:Uncharacterized protein n=1 Tax=Mesonia ostreae TaxID=861110 RepID=A0ABU2KJD7_9FLAO|nr:hypothetical protein [Mesonia ostreae]MDT0294832.1 hypothetical protein [Mesonia ostreae]